MKARLAQLAQIWYLLVNVARRRLAKYQIRHQAARALSSQADEVQEPSVTTSDRQVRVLSSWLMLVEPVTSTC